MTRTRARPPWHDAASLAALHACRTQDELEREFADGLRRLLPEAGLALCLADDGEGRQQVRFALGPCPLRAFEHVAVDAWPVPAAQRLPVRFKSHVLGQLLLAGAPPDAETARVLEDALTHFGTALVNLVLNSEARQATDDYCASLQALEEGIVLFQEADPEAVMARVLALATGMVQATAGALYVLEEVGNRTSPLVLQQALGIPDSLLATFRGEDGQPWPDALLDWPAQIVGRSETGGIGGLSPASAPPVLQELVVLPLRYHGVQAGVCLLFNPLFEGAHNRDHIGRLQSFGQLAAALLHRLNLEALKERSRMIERELEIANTIQQRLVPTAAPPCDDYDFAWHTLAAKSIGGDYVDFLTDDGGELGAIVADASGHGINSALLMTSFRANYRSGAVRHGPGELAATLNESVVHEVGPTGMFITAALLRIDPARRQMTLCSAGHNPVLLWRAARNAVEAIESHGPPMGFVPGVRYTTSTATLEPGDVVLLYTDGITEATDAELEMFGEERLAALLQQHAAGPAQGVLDAALQALATFTGREHHDDDVTLLVIKVR